MQNLLHKWIFLEQAFIGCSKDPWPKERLRMPAASEFLPRGWTWKPFSSHQLSNSTILFKCQSARFGQQAGRVLRPTTPWGPKNHGRLEQAGCSMTAACCCPGLSGRWGDMTLQMASEPVVSPSCSHAPSQTQGQQFLKSFNPWVVEVAGDFQMVLIHYEPQAPAATIVLSPGTNLSHTVPLWLWQSVPQCDWNGYIQTSPSSGKPAVR